MPLQRIMMDPERAPQIERWRQQCRTRSLAWLAADLPRLQESRLPRDGC
jgi:hypothetical protein